MKTEQNQLSPLPEIKLAFENPSTSYWLKNALNAALDRDCFDALRDAEALVALLKTRL